MLVEAVRIVYLLLHALDPTLVHVSCLDRVGVLSHLIVRKF